MITVEPVNDAPVAASAGNAAGGDEDTVIEGVVPAASDVDDGSEGLRYTLLGDAVPGLTLADDGSFRYQPAADFNGDVRFQYAVVDAAGAASAPQEFVITVEPVNDAPVLASGALQTVEDAGLSPLGFEAPVDVDDDPLTITVLELPSIGTVRDANGAVVGLGDEIASDAVAGLAYEAPTALGEDADAGQVRVLVSDGTEEIQATVAVSVAARDDGPVARQDFFRNDLLFRPDDLLRNDTDGDGGDTLRFVGVPESVDVSDPFAYREAFLSFAELDLSSLDGQLVFDLNTDQIRYLPPGGEYSNMAVDEDRQVFFDRFSYTVTDSSGETATATGEFRLSVSRFDGRSVPDGYQIAPADASADTSEISDHIAQSLG